MRVKEWMSPDPITVGSRTTVFNARRLILAYGIRYLPVVDARGRLVGIVRSDDVLPPDHQASTPVGALEWDLLIGRYRTIETIMRSPGVVIHPEEELAAATKIMLGQGVDALPVAQGGVVVGVLTASDCLRGLLETIARKERSAREVEVDPDGYKPVPLESFT